MRFETRIDIDAAPEAVWSAVSGIWRWPEFIPTMDAVTRLDDGPLGVGSRARLKQPRMPALEWRVTEWDEGRSFAWQSRSLGVATTGTHTIVVREDGGTTLVLGIDQTGPAAPVVGLLTGGQTRRYVTMEAAAFKAACEADAADGGPNTDDETPGPPPEADPAHPAHPADPADPADISDTSDTADHTDRKPGSA